jgi:hypothetical protein
MNGRRNARVRAIQYTLPTEMKRGEERKRCSTDKTKQQGKK